MSIVLRPAGPADYDAIAQIWHRSASLPGVGPAQMPTLDELRQRVGIEFASGWEVTLATQAGDVVGFLALDRRNAVLDQLFVSPGAIGGGIGRLLFAEAQAAMPDGFTLFTRAGNQRARRFYEKMGMVWLRDDIHPRFGDGIVYYGWKAERRQYARLT